MQHGCPPQFELPPLASGLGPAGFGEITPIVQQVMVQVDVHRANAGTRAAQ